MRTVTMGSTRMGCHLLVNHRVSMLRREGLPSRSCLRRSVVPLRNDVGVLAHVVLGFRVGHYLKTHEESLHGGAFVFVVILIQQLHLKLQLQLQLQPLPLSQSRLLCPGSPLAGPVHTLTTLMASPTRQPVIQCLRCLVSQGIDAVLNCALFCRVRAHRLNQGLGHVRIVVVHEELHGLVSETGLQIAAKLCSQHLVVAEDKGGMVLAVDHVGHDECFAKWCLSTMC